MTGTRETAERAFRVPREDPSFPFGSAAGCLEASGFPRLGGPFPVSNLLERLAPVDIANVVLLVPCGAVRQRDTR